jgi:hypothetical protein
MNEYDDESMVVEGDIDNIDLVARHVTPAA